VSHGQEWPDVSEVSGLGFDWEPPGEVMADCFRHFAASCSVVESAGCVAESTGCVVESMGRVMVGFARDSSARPKAAIANATGCSNVKRGRRIVRSPSDWRMADRLIAIRLVAAQTY